MGRTTEGGERPVGILPHTAAAAWVFAGRVACARGIRAHLWSAIVVEGGQRSNLCVGVFYV